MAQVPQGLQPARQSVGTRRIRGRHREVSTSLRAVGPGPVSEHHERAIATASARPVTVAIAPRGGRSQRVSSHGRPARPAAASLCAS
eukprot:11200251-Alexandrium_andersonii.AAC.1